MTKGNPLVYTVLVRNKKPFEHAVYISSIFKKQEDAWSHIEKLLYNYIELIKTNDKSNSKTISVKIESDRVVLNYKDFVLNMYGTVTYEIDRFEVK